MRAVHKPKQAISNVRGSPSSYDTATRFEDGSWQTYVITHCIECGEEHIIHWNTGGSDPRFVEKKFRGLGWHFDAFKPKQCVCPTCVKGEGILSREEPMKTNSYTPPVTDTAVLSAARVQANADETVGRPLTAHEKAKIRALLDSHFDDAIGRYIDNYDDQRIGKETGLPWALVAEYRELAYGPIKADPAVEAVKADTVALRQEFVQLSNALEAIRSRIQQIEGRLVNVEAKAKKLS